MRGFLTQRVPPFQRFLLIESGSRQIVDRIIPVLYNQHGPGLHIDVVTCFAGEPAGFQAGRDSLYRVTDYQSREQRRQLLQQLRQNQYNIMAVLCSAEPIMTKWKWVLAARLPAKLLIINENGDYFWADYSNIQTMLNFALFRAGLAGSEAAGTIGRLLLFPFTLLFLLSYAAVVHLRRRVRA